MTPPLLADPPIETIGDLLERLGSVPPERVRMRPAPGTATENDVLVQPNGVKRLCELVDGVLVEKAMGYYESRLAALLIHFLEDFLELHDLGIVFGADATLRLAPGLVRIPDVSFISWDKFPNRVLPPEPMPDLAPDLAVEVLSRSNTEKETARKLRDYFAAGTQLAWCLDPQSRTLRVYQSPLDFIVLTESDTVDGGSVLPGFELSIAEWFRRAGRQQQS